jgi:succinate dehydrogenase/fumarate reductase-like Fe-S protein
MKTVTKLITVLCAVFLTACGAIPANHNPFRPAIIENAVDMNQYEKDRSDCEKGVTNAPSNMESTNSLRFRDCLVKKGYKLMS